MSIWKSLLLHRKDIARMKRAAGVVKYMYKRKEYILQIYIFTLYIFGTYVQSAGIVNLLCFSEI